MRATEVGQGGGNEKQVLMRRLLSKKLISTRNSFEETVE